MRRLFQYLPICFFSMSTTLFASGQTDQIKALIEAGQAKEAYQLAISQLESYEGDPAFDLQYGIAAIDNRKVSEGVFALERVVSVEPDNAMARLELARGYYLLALYEKSKQLFNEVLQLNPPQNVQIRINQYLAWINKETTKQPTQFESFIELWSGYDSNVNTGPENQTDLVTLSDSALGRSDLFNQIRISAKVDHAYAENESLTFGFNADMRYYDTESAQEYKSMTFTGGHIWKRDRDKFQVNAVLQNYSLNNEDYRTLMGVNGSWSRRLGEDSLLKTFIGINSLSYDSLTWKDSTQINLGANYIFAETGRFSPVYFMGMFVGQETPDTAGVLADAEVDRLFYGGNLGVQLKLSDDLILVPAMTYQSSRYAGEDWIYKVKRKDDLVILNLSLEWALQDAWTVLARYSSTFAGSNIELYEYDRHQAMLGVRYNFQ